jgi:pSer/pThr/pTyr-binding forkhead associated (FHA) protein
MPGCQLIAPAAFWRAGRKSLEPDDKRRPEIGKLIKAGNGNACRFSVDPLFMTAPTLEPTASPASAPAFIPHLIIQYAEGTPEWHALNEERVTIGKHPKNTIVLNDESVSGKHAEITSTGGVCTLTDIYWSSGTAVNGKEVREQVLEDGDSISFGNVACRFRVLQP